MALAQAAVPEQYTSAEQLGSSRGYNRMKRVHGPLFHYNINLFSSVSPLIGLGSCSLRSFLFFSIACSVDVPLRLQNARYLNFKKAATCSHSSGREWLRVAASGRRQLSEQVAASVRKWLLGLQTPVRRATFLKT